MREDFKYTPDEAEIIRLEQLTEVPESILLDETLLQTYTKGDVGANEFQENLNSFRTVLGKIFNPEIFSAYLDSMINSGNVPEDLYQKSCDFSLTAFRGVEFNFLSYNLDALERRKHLSSLSENVPFTEIEHKRCYEFLGFSKKQAALAVSIIFLQTALSSYFDELAERVDNEEIKLKLYSMAGNMEVSENLVQSLVPAIIITNLVLNDKKDSAPLTQEAINKAIEFLTIFGAFNSELTNPSGEKFMSKCPAFSFIVKIFSKDAFFMKIYDAIKDCKYEKANDSIDALYGKVKEKR